MSMLKKFAGRAAAFIFLAALLPACGKKSSPPTLTVIGFFPPLFNATDSNVPLFTELYVNFSAALSVGTVNTTNFTLGPTGGAPVTISLTYNPVLDQVIITPSTFLAANTQFTLSISPSVTDTSGDPFDGFQGTFMTTNFGSNTVGPPSFASGTGLTAGPGGSAGVIHLTWNAATDAGATTIDYDVYIGTVSLGEDYSAPYTAAGVISSTSVDVSGLSSGLTYFFVVRAHDNFGNQDRNTTETFQVSP